MSGLPPEDALWLLGTGGDGDYIDIPMSWVAMKDGLSEYERTEALWTGHTAASERAS